MPNSDKFESAKLDPIDHLGLRLARAYQAFKREMLSELHKAGFRDLTSVHLLILPQVKPTGSRISELVESLGMAKQAVSRSLIDMQKLGYVELLQDKQDKRAKIVMRGHKAKAMIEASIPIKNKFQNRVAHVIGPNALESMMDQLRAIEVEFSET